MHRLIVALSALTCLSSCVSLLPEKVAPNALYRLGPVTQTESVALTQNVLIRQPEAPRLLSGIDIVARDGSGALRLVNSVQWADRMPRLLQMSLLDHLDASGGGVGLLPETGARADFEMTWRISDFLLEGDKAIARAELTLLDGKTRVPLRQLEIFSEQIATGSAPDKRAVALSAAGHDLAYQAAQFVANTIESQ